MCVSHRGGKPGRNGYRLPLGFLTLLLVLGAGPVAAQSAARPPVSPVAYTGETAPGGSDLADTSEAPLIDTGMGRAPAGDDGDTGMPADDPASEPNVTTPAPALPVLRDLSKLPEPVRMMRRKIEEAARSGDIEKLRPLLGKGSKTTQLAISGQEGDPIAYLKSLSGDPDGREILAILLDVLDTGFVDMDPGTPNETYVWPYFFAARLDTLTPRQSVELLRLVTAGDLDEMQAMGHYNFFRIGLAPDGTWTFFVAGD